MPFLHHKAAAYEFARQQVLDEGQALSETTTFAIATLALAEVRLARAACRGERRC